VTSDTDTRYFDAEFTGETVELTPPEQNILNSISEEVELPNFTEFSFTGAGTLSASLNPISHASTLGPLPE
jgi:hypothetical protein